MEHRDDHPGIKELERHLRGEVTIPLDDLIERHPELIPIITGLDTVWWYAYGYHGSQSYSHSRTGARGRSVSQSRSSSQPISCSGTRDFSGWLLWRA